MIVICLNDYPVGVMVEGTTEIQAHVMCQKLKQEYMANHPQTNPKIIYFHQHDVPTLRHES